MRRRDKTLYVFWKFFFNRSRGMREVFFGFIEKGGVVWVKIILKYYNLSHMKNYILF